jgi:hypothetical protein
MTHSELNRTPEGKAEFLKIFENILKVNIHS